MLKSDAKTIEKRSTGILRVEKQFVLNAPQERVWGLLGGVIYQCLPVEKVDVINEWLFNAELKLRFGFTRIPLKLKVELTEINPPGSLGTKIRIRVGIVQFLMAVTFMLRQVNGDKTEVIGMAKDEGRQAISRWVLSKQRRDFAEKIFDSVEARLRQLI